MQDNNKETHQDNNCLDDSKTRIFDKNFEELLKGKDDVMFSDIYSNSSPEKHAEEKEPKRKKKKERKRMPVGIRLLFIFMISIVLAGSIIFSAVEILGINFNETYKTEIVIKQGISTKDIADVLEENNIINSSFLFTVYAKLTGANNLKYGIYELSNNQSYGDIIDTLSNQGEIGDTVEITIPEGYSVNQIAELLENNKVCSKKDFIKVVKYSDFDYDFIKQIPQGTVYYRLEGYLFPDTYQFFVCSDEEKGEDYAYKAVDKMLRRMDSEINDELVSTADKKGYSVHEILTMASVVELEASGYPDEMKKVAQVFYNRLRWVDQPALMGSTPTSNYPDSRYDTNKKEGLPPGPLCSPSQQAIEAALNPDTTIKSDYFVTDKNMKFYYTDSYSEHMELIEKLKSEGLWN